MSVVKIIVAIKSGCCDGYDMNITDSIVALMRALEAANCYCGEMSAARIVGALDICIISSKQT